MVLNIFFQLQKVDGGQSGRQGRDKTLDFQKKKLKWLLEVAFKHYM